MPTELLKFVNNDSYSLLVKGNPGTGKTTFALTLMDNLDHNSNYFYISTRQSIKHFHIFILGLANLQYQPNQSMNINLKMQDWTNLNLCLNELLIN